ncbi:MAG: OmpA family protein [Bacteroidetes bacterium]|nr:OmpA family protein [Bacteroidota bacterium]
MKKTFLYVLLTIFTVSTLLISCGPSKKLLVSEAKVAKLQKDSTKTHNQLNDCNTQLNNLNDEKTALQSKNASTQNDLNALASESKLTIAEQAKRLKNFQDIIQSQKNVMDKLKNSISEALLNYKTDELSVYIKDGNVYVSLQEKLLFKSGSDVVDPKGVEALKTLAKVLISTKDITVLIEGHTDNVPIKTALFKDNWDLSTARAISIVRILTKDKSFDSNRITAAGRGQFHPVSTNETLEGRASNRRTEVILSPDLKEIYKLLYQ